MIIRKHVPRLREVGWAAGGCIVIAWAAGAEPVERPRPLPPASVELSIPASLSPLAPAQQPTALPELPALPPSRTLLLQPLPLVTPVEAPPPNNDSQPDDAVQHVSSLYAVELRMPPSLLALPAPPPEIQQQAPPAALDDAVPGDAPQTSRHIPELAALLESGHLIGLVQTPPPLPTPPPLEYPPVPEAVTQSAAAPSVDAPSQPDQPNPTPEQPTSELPAPELPALELALPSVMPGDCLGPVPCLPPCQPGDPGCCSAGAGCHEEPAVSFPSTVHNDLLELLAVDIARRTLLAIHPYAAKRPIITLDVVVRPQGHEVHTYARLQWTRRHWWQGEHQVKTYISEVTASLLYHPDKRLIYDISYSDNGYLPFRNIDMSSQVVASYNEQFGMLDKTGLPPKFLSTRIDVLEPYPAGAALIPGPVQEPHPRAQSLRTIRRDSNVTANR